MSSPQQLEGGAYEVIRARLDKQAEDLRARLDTLNAARQEVFGAVETALLATERVATDHNCIPRDIFHIGGGLILLGYNIQFGLKQTTDVSDVFAIHRFDFEQNIFHPVPWESVLGAAEFLEDFQALYRFYRNTFFAKFMPVGPHVHMKMRVGATEDEFKTFKWLIKGDGVLEYVGNRFDHECRYPPPQEFEWKRAHRDMQRRGAYPHISIEDIIFVETTGGDLTIKVEDNTDSGQGIYSEPVTDADQSLDDAEILYAVVGPLILLRILPYREDLHRHFVFNAKTKSVHRLDSIGQSCVFLPQDQGLIFANGYLLATGDVKTFEIGHGSLRFERRITASNGEDTLYVFYQRRTGHYVLYSYNAIAQTVTTPMICNGFALLDNGELIATQVPDQAQKHHAFQIWRTPYSQDLSASAPAEKKNSLLFKIGNAELVRAMAECRELLVLLGKDDTYGDLYIDLVRITRTILDSYFWLEKPEASELSIPLGEINRAGNAAISEFDKVQRLRQVAVERQSEVSEKAAKLIAAARLNPPDSLAPYVASLTALRQLRGEIIGLRDIRYTDAVAIDSLEKEVTETTNKVSSQTVDFLLKPGSLDSYRIAVETQRESLKTISKTIEADATGKNLDTTASELEMLIDVVGNLKIDDPTRTTSIIESISAVYAMLNGTRADLKNKRRDLSRLEGAAGFAAQNQLLSQAVVNYLDLCDTPAKCGEFLAKIMLQVEDLEARFSDFDEFIEQISIKREEIHEAFEARKISLIEQRDRRASALLKSADRILAGVAHRVATLDSLDAIHGFFAGDSMLAKLRDIEAELRALGDSVKADDIQTKLKTAQLDAARQHKDQQELQSGGRDTIQFGKHTFSVNTQALDLSIIPRDGEMCYHLSGTAYFEPVTDPAFLATRDVWNQDLPGENPTVYRAEWAVHCLLEDGTPVSTIADVQAWLAPRYAEGYIKGVHDEDIWLIYQAIAPIHNALEVLRHSPRARIVAMLFWECHRATPAGTQLENLLNSHGSLRRSFSGTGDGVHPYAEMLVAPIVEFIKSSVASAIIMVLGKSAEPEILAREAAACLFDELIVGNSFAVSAEAAAVTKEFKQALTAKQAAKALDAAIAPFAEDPERRFLVLLDWITGQMRNTNGDAIHVEAVHITSPVAWCAEAAVHWTRGGFEMRHVATTACLYNVSGLRGQHPMIGDGGVLTGDYHAFRDRLRYHAAHSLPKFEAYIRLKLALVDAKKRELRLEEFKPKVMSAFVRNKLINDVYLPLIGANLAKQIGVAGTNTRTDRMGLLLLVSPPGYGKTTIMEYVANRLGLTFMKINGPSLGHSVVSFDPGESTNLSAREEIEKLNLALEMGDNIMLYVDDIQHTNPEFLQRFISLCDAQRRVEGVWKGNARTYDLRGKKVAVVMAGNPYTEGGTKFKIPDMLANRADTYNLGEILGGHADAFKASYIENCLTSNQTLSKLASRHQEDVHAVMRIAATGDSEGVEFKGNYAPAEIDEMVTVTRHLLVIRDTILRVNLEYIRSAAQEDAYRTEPAFKLQGSYRNMNKIAEKVLPLMTDAEIRGLINDHYKNESQTLTQGAEANLLKFNELEGTLTEVQAKRWEDIKKEFRKRRLLGGAGDSDPVSRVVAQLSQFSDGLEAIHTGIHQAAESYAKPQTLDASTIERLESIIANLRAVPVEVDIKVMPVQQEGGSIQSMESAPGASSLPVNIEPDVRQGE